VVARSQLVAAELRVTLASVDDWPLLRSMLELAAERAAAEGGPVRYVSGTYLPEDGRLLCVFAAPSIDAVRSVLWATSLPTVRIGPAVSLPDLDPRSNAA
jgi:hypothetical protein